MGCVHVFLFIVDQYANRTATALESEMPFYIVSQNSNCVIELLNLKIPLYL